MTTRARFDVVVVAYRSEDSLLACLQAASLAPGLDKVVVIDHGDGRSAAVAASLGALTVTNPANPGFGAGQNRGILATEAPYVLLLNPDAEVEASGLASGLDYLASHSRVAAVQGVIRNRHSGMVERSQGEELTAIHLLGRAIGARRLLRFGAVRRLARRLRSVHDHAERIPREPVPVAYLAATAVLARREALESVGGFDERYFLYGEDLDLGRRLRDAGWELVALPSEWAQHDSGGSSASWWARELEWWRGTMAFGARWWTSRMWAAAMVAGVIRCAGLLVHHPVRIRSVVGAVLAEPLRIRRTETRRGQSRQEQLQVMSSMR